MHTSSLVLLPGSLCDWRLWQPQLAALRAEAAVTVGDLTQDDSIGAMARRVLTDAPPRFALAGLSLGGIVALEMVRQAPERVERLALLSTSARPASAQQREQWRHLGALVRDGQLHDVVHERLLPTLFEPGRPAEPRLTRLVAAMADSVGPTAYLRQLAALSTRADSRPHLAQIACPTLLVAGRLDAVCPVALHEEMAAAITGARLSVIARCGHLSSLEQPRAVGELLRGWLGKRSAAEDRVISSDEAR